MPVSKNRSTPQATRALGGARAVRTGKKMTPVVIQSHHSCKSCAMLPVGSIELTSLLLVLVFSLVSVLLTSVLALNSEHQKVAALQAEVAVAK